MVCPELNRKLLYVDKNQEGRLPNFECWYVGCAMDHIRIFSIGLELACNGG